MAVEGTFSSACRLIGLRAALTVLLVALLWAPAEISMAQGPVGSAAEPTAGATDLPPEPKDPLSELKDGWVGGGGSGPPIESTDPPKTEAPKDEPPKTDGPKDPPARPTGPPTNYGPKDEPKGNEPNPPKSDGGSDQKPKPEPKSDSKASNKPSPPPAQPRERPAPPPPARVKQSPPAKATPPTPRKKAKSPARKGASGQSTAQVGAVGPSPARAQVAQTSVTGNSFVSQDVRRRRAQVGPFAMVRIVGRFNRRGARVRLLTVTAPRSSTVTVRCRGRGCGARSQSRVVAAAAEPMPATKRLRFTNVERNLRAGTVIEVSVTQADAVGKYTRFVIRAGKPPLRRDLCIAPGATRPTSCA